MKIKEIRKLKEAEMNKKFAELQSELINLQGQAASGTPPKNPGQIKKIKLIIARIKTIRREKEIEELKVGKQLPEKQKEEQKANARN